MFECYKDIGMSDPLCRRYNYTPILCVNSYFDNADFDKSSWIFLFSTVIAFRACYISRQIKHYFRRDNLNTPALILTNYGRIK